MNHLYKNIIYYYIKNEGGEMIELGNLDLNQCIELLREIRYFETDSPSKLNDMIDLQIVIEYLWILELHINNKREFEKVEK